VSTALRAQPPCNAVARRTSPPLGRDPTKAAWTKALRADGSAGCCRADAERRRSGVGGSARTRHVADRHDARPYGRIVNRHGRQHDPQYCQGENPHALRSLIGFWRAWLRSVPVPKHLRSVFSAPGSAALPSARRLYVLWAASTIEPRRKRAFDSLLLAFAFYLPH
jgi:hypothetical protein